MKSFALWVVVAGLFIHPSITPAATTNVFSTEFEPGEGYSTNFYLAGQVDWLGDGSGDNGIVFNYIAGQGQQAFIGGSSPLPADKIVAVWRPIDFAPIPTGFPIVNFSVLLNIADSLNDAWDTFSWSVYNSQGDWLFSLDFDNYVEFLDVSYQLNGTNELVITDVTYVNNSNYTLTVTMNFAANHWNARLNNSVIATNQPITTTMSPLNLGEIEAAWLIYETNAPGDNFMLFDNYHISAERLPAPPAQVQFLGRTGDGQAILRVFSDNDSRWALEATTNFVNWIAIKTNQVSGTYFDQVDTTAGGFQHRFYRARFVP